MNGLYIGEASKRLGLNPRTLRYYESIGLLTPKGRTEGGFRVYTDQDLERLDFIRKAQRLGFRLGEIREIIGFRDQGMPPCDYVRELIEQKRMEVDRRIAELRELKATLDGLAASAAVQPRGGPEEGQGICHIIEGYLSGKAGSAQDRGVTE